MKVRAALIQQNFKLSKVDLVDGEGEWMQLMSKDERKNRRLYNKFKGLKKINNTTLPYPNASSRGFKRTKQNQTSLKIARTMQLTTFFALYIAVFF